MIKNIIFFHKIVPNEEAFVPVLAEELDVWKIKLHVWDRKEDKKWTITVGCIQTTDPHFNYANFYFKPIIDIVTARIRFNYCDLLEKNFTFEEGWLPLEISDENFRGPFFLKNGYDDLVRKYVSNLIGKAARLDRKIIMLSRMDEESPKKPEHDYWAKDKELYLGNDFMLDPELYKQGWSNIFWVK